MARRIYVMPFTPGATSVNSPSAGLLLCGATPWVAADGDLAAMAAEGEFLY
jgi:hypothetical protein